jgi:tetratricopeptide (TPR) repeat protein
MAAVATHPDSVPAPFPTADAELAVEAAEAQLQALGAKRALETLQGVVASRLEPQLALRAIHARAAAELELGAVDAALALLDGATPLADDPDVTSVARARTLYLRGAALLASGSVAAACSELTLALETCNRSAEPSDLLRSEILERRARCHRHNRDWPAARADVERALELAESLGDTRATAQACLQASIVSEREGQWIIAQFYAERARQLFVELGDVHGVGRCLNNLGGLAFLLDRVDEARKHLKESFAILLDLGRDVDAAYAVSSLAQVQLRTGEFDDAERLARRALVFIGSRVDHRTELGNAQLVLGRALMEQERLDEADEMFRTAEHTLEHAAAGERAAVWIAQGESAIRRDDAHGAVVLFRRAAEALQDFHF